MRTAKRELIEALEQMPDDTPVDALVLEVQFKASVLRGLDDAQHGRVTSHEEVKERLKTWRESPGRTKPFDV